MDKVYTESYILDFRTSKQQELLKNFTMVSIARRFQLSS